MKYLAVDLVKATAFQTNYVNNTFVLIVHFFNGSIDVKALNFKHLTAGSV